MLSGVNNWSPFISILLTILSNFFMRFPFWCTKIYAGRVPDPLTKPPVLSINRMRRHVKSIIVQNSVDAIRADLVNVLIINSIPADSLKGFLIGFRDLISFRWCVPVLFSDGWCIAISEVSRSPSSDSAAACLKTFSLLKNNEIYQVNQYLFIF